MTNGYIVDLFKVERVISFSPASEVLLTMVYEGGKECETKINEETKAMLRHISCYIPVKVWVAVCCSKVLDGF